MLIGAVQSFDREMSMPRSECGGGFVQRMLAHVHRHIANRSVCPPVRFQQELGFSRAAGAQFDDRRGTGQPPDSVRMRLENRSFGPREIVLTPIADSLEQLAP